MVSAVVYKTIRGISVLIRIYSLFAVFIYISLFHDTYSKGKSSADLKIIECGLVTTYHAAFPFALGNGRLN